ncbi:MAG: hypothetical protein PXY39_04860 [archaeon]|nr:hypothetical protein [archaeon]
MTPEKETYQKLVDSLFELPFLRYAVVTDDFGRRYAGGMKPGVESTTPVEIEKRLEAQAVLILKMAEGYVPYDGKVLWSSIRWEKVIALFFLLGEGKGTLSLTVQGVTKFDSFDKILKIIDNWKNAAS